MLGRVAYGLAVFSLGLGLLRTKLIAVSLGVSGAGAFGTFSMYAGASGSIACLGLWSTAAAVFGQQADAQRRRLVRVILATSVAVFVAGLPTAHLLFPGSSFGFIVLVSMSGSLSGVASIAIVAWRSSGNAKLLIWGTVAGQIFGTGLTVVSALTEQLPLAMLGVAISFLIPAVIFISTELGRRGPNDFLVSSAPRWLGPLAIASLCFVVYRQAPDVLMRARIEAGLGERSNGLLQPYFLYSTVLLPQIASVWLVSIAASVGRGDGRHARQIGWGIGALAVGSLTLTCASGLVIDVFFSNAFREAAPLLALGSATEILRWTVVATGSILLVDGQWKIVVAGAALGILGRLAFFELLIVKGFAAGALPLAVAGESFALLVFFRLVAGRSLQRVPVLGSVLVYLGIMIVVQGVASVQ